jgi:hypothetical protein
MTTQLPVTPLVPPLAPQAPTHPAVLLPVPPLSLPASADEPLFEPDDDVPSTFTPVLPVWWPHRHHADVSFAAPFGGAAMPLAGLLEILASMSLSFSTNVVEFAEISHVLNTCGRQIHRLLMRPEVRRQAISCGTQAETLLSRYVQALPVVDALVLYNTVVCINLCVACIQI